MLKDYIKQFRGVSYKPTDILDKNSNNAVPIVRANNIQERGLNFDDLVYIDKSKVKDEQYLQAGDIVICASSGSKDLVGKAAYCLENKKASFGAFCKVVRTSALHKKYLSHFFQSDRYRREISESSKGANINNIRNEDIDNLQIIVPSIEEQQRIADELDKVSGLIEKRQKQLEKLDLLIKSRFVEMFQCGSKNKIQLQSICEICSSKRIFEKEYVEDGVPFYRTKEIVELSCGKEISTELFIGYEKYIEIKKNYSVPMKNDLLITAIGTIGVIWIVNDESEFYFKDGNILWIKASEKFNSIFMKELLVNEIKNYKNKMVAGTAYMALTIAGLKNMEINLPPMELQNQFADFVEKVEQNKSNIKNSLDKLITLKKALMQKYFG